MQQPNILEYSVGIGIHVRLISVFVEDLVQYRVDGRLRVLMNTK